MDKETLYQDIKIIHKYNLDMTIEIINILLNQKNYYPAKKTFGRKLVFKNLVIINKSNIKKCKDLIMNDKLIYNRIYQSNTLIGNYFKKNFYSSYALLI